MSYEPVCYRIWIWTHFQLGTKTRHAISQHWHPDPWFLRRLTLHNCAFTYPTIQNLLTACRDLETFHYTLDKKGLNNLTETHMAVSDYPNSAQLVDLLSPFHVSLFPTLYQGLMVALVLKAFDDIRLLHQKLFGSQLVFSWKTCWLTVKIEQNSLKDFVMILSCPGENEEDFHDVPFTSLAEFISLERLWTATHRWANFHQDSKDGHRIRFEMDSVESSHPTSKASSSTTRTSPLL